MLYRIKPTFDKNQTVSMHIDVLNSRGIWENHSGGNPECVLADLPNKAFKMVANVLFRKPSHIYFHSYN